MTETEKRKRIHYEVFSTRDEAIKREEFFKTERGREWLKSQKEKGLLNGRQAGVDLFDLICHVAYDQERIRTLTVPLIKGFGTVTEIIRAFGSREEYERAIKELENEWYKTV